MISPTMVAHASRNGCLMISQLTLQVREALEAAPRSPPPRPADSDRSAFSMSVMIWAKAKMPISTGRKESRRR